MSFTPLQCRAFYANSSCNENTDFIYEYYRDEKTFHVTRQAILDAFRILLVLNMTYHKYKGLITDVANRIVTEPYVGGIYVKMSFLWKNQMGVIYWLVNNVMASSNPSHMSS